MSKTVLLENLRGPVLLPTPEVQQAQQLLARQQMAVAMEQARILTAAQIAAQDKSAA